MKIDAVYLYIMENLLLSLSCSTENNVLQSVLQFYSCWYHLRKSFSPCYCLLPLTIGQTIIRHELKHVCILVWIHPNKSARKLSLYYATHKWLRLSPLRSPMYTRFLYMCGWDSGNVPATYNWPNIDGRFLAGSLRWIWTRIWTCLSSSLLVMMHHSGNWLHPSVSG